MTSAERAKISDPSVMRALAHPARLEIIEYLSMAKEGATATECADLVGLSPSATSYHLRALAKVGMIQEGPSRGDGRERVWQASYSGYSVDAEFDASQVEREAEAAVIEAFLARQNERVRRYIAKARNEAAEWFNAATMTDAVISVNPDELKDLLKKIDQLVEPIKRINRTDAPADARPVSFQLRAVPID